MSLPVAPPRPLRVLVVEDDADLGEAMRELLQDEGHRVLVAVSLEQAIDAIHGAENFDVLIADHQLQGESADRLFDVLATSPSPPSTILCSGTPSLVSLAEAYGLYFIAKPFELEAMIALVASAAEHPRRPSRPQAG